MHACGTVCSLNVPSVPPLFPALAVRLRPVIVLSSKLWAEVTCVAFRPKYERAGTWSSGYVFSCHGDWGGREWQTLALQDVRLRISLSPRVTVRSTRPPQLLPAMDNEETNLCVLCSIQRWRMGLSSSCSTSILSWIKERLKSKNLKMFT